MSIETDLPLPPVENTPGALTSFTYLHEFLRSGWWGKVPDDFGGITARRYAVNSGLGDGHTPDGTALATFFAALPTAFTQNNVDRASNGIAGELPPGVYGTVGGTPQVLTGPTGAHRGAILVVGQGSEVTTLTLPSGAAGSRLAITSATRSANTFTLAFAAPHGKTAGQPVAVQVASMPGAIKWNHYTISDAAPGGDNTKLAYRAGAVGDANLNKLVTVGGFACFPNTFLNVLGFRDPTAVFFDRMSIIGPNNFGDPRDGIGLRLSSRCTVGNDFRSAGWWANYMVNGTDYGSPGTPQNTDHSWCFAKAGAPSDGGAHVLFLDNAPDAWPATGGGRDNHFQNVLMAATSPGGASFRVSDGGCLMTLDVGGINSKSSSYFVEFEGVDGVAPVQPQGIDTIFGVGAKLETFGTAAYYDWSKKRSIARVPHLGTRVESSAGINGGGGPTNNDNTDKPFAVTNVSLTTVLGHKVITATFPTGAGAHITPGDIMAIVCPVQTGLTAPDALRFSVDGRMVFDITGDVVSAFAPDGDGDGLPDLAGPFTGTAGFCCYMRIGEFRDNAFDTAHDVGPNDKVCAAQLFYDVGRLLTGSLDITATDSTQPQQRNRLPWFRVDDVINATATMDDFSFVITRGTDRFVPYPHDPTDPATSIEPGDLVECAVMGHATAVRQSVASKNTFLLGIAQTGNTTALPEGDAIVDPANGGRCIYRSAVILVAEYPSSITPASNDLTQGLANICAVNADGTIAANKLVVDAGNGHCQVVALTTGVPTAGQRVIGKSLRAASAGVVAVKLCVPYWTT